MIVTYIGLALSVMVGVLAAFAVLTATAAVSRWSRRRWRR